MSLIRLEDRHAAAVAAHDGEGRVENRQAECEDRHDQRNRRGALDGADDRDAREHEAEELAARVAHEDLGRIEVVVEEAEGCACESGRQHGDEDDALLQGHEEDRDGRNRRDACGEAVEAVDEVDRVRQADEPEDCRRDGEELEVDVVAERVRDEVDADIKGKDEHTGRDDLAQEFHLGRQIDVVVDEADDEDDRAADQEADDLVEDLRRDLGEGQDAEDCHHESEIDANAANARNRLLVDLSRIRGIHCPRFPRKADDTRRQQQCHTGSNDERQHIDWHTSALLFLEYTAALLQCHRHPECNPL